MTIDKKKEKKRKLPLNSRSHSKRPITLNQVLRGRGFEC